MNYIYILSQFFGFLAFVISLMAYHKKKKSFKQ